MQKTKQSIQLLRQESDK